ncbi:MAG: metalloregulator ArsR/SmtB family transcription factor [Desulfovibrio sp.]|nr:metalloregulator ArsR/SmtB family transcription factor [Desulfovibrio sp.]
MSETSQYFKALADETRLRLLSVLCRYELNVNELVIILTMGQSRISRHLKILSASGLLASRREGLWVFYSAAHEGKSRAFIDAILPFIEQAPSFIRDRAMAANMIEARAHKTWQFFNSIAEDWDKLSRDILGDFDLPQAVMRHMPDCAVAADLGCGTGNMLLPMLDKARRIIGVDGSARMLELARRRFSSEGERISLRIGDLAHLPLRDGEANFISLTMVLHHAVAPGTVLCEIRRVLSPGGRLVLTDFNRHEDENMRLEYGDHWLGFEQNILQTHLASAGFAMRESTLIRVKRGLELHIIVAEHPQ